MPTDRPYLDYRKLAAHLARLPLSATNADLVKHLGAFQGAGRLAAVICKLLPEGEYLPGLLAIADALHVENRRFDEGLFLDWATDEH